MEKVDIAHERLYVQRIINVIRSRNANCGRLLQVKNRYSDALVYIISGSCTYGFEDEDSFTVAAGDILYLSRGADYTMFIHGDDYRFIFCDFDFGGGDIRRCGVYRPQDIEGAENMFNRLLRQHGENAYAECMALLYGIYAAVRRTADRTYMGNNARNKAEAAKAYIDAHFADAELGVGMLARMAQLSEVYFRRLFRQYNGMPPSQYIAAVRLRKAKELMRYPFFTLEECALQSGFASLQYFCRVFKKETGDTPARYRSRELRGMSGF